MYQAPSSLPTQQPWTEANLWQNRLTYGDANVVNVFNQPFINFLHATLVTP